MPMILNERQVGPITLLELGDRLTIEFAGELREVVERVGASGHSAFLLDCSRLTAVDSMGIGGLVANWISVKKRGGKLKLLNPSERMQEVLQIVGLRKVIESFDDIEHALRNF
jgi:anti-sigma B factor antagonist